MAQEIERKFMVTGEYKMYAHKHIHLVQGYIASGRRTVRVRISDDAAWLTIKGPSKEPNKWNIRLLPTELKRNSVLATECLLIQPY